MFSWVALSDPRNDGEESKPSTGATMVEGADQVGEDWQGLSFLGKLVRCQCVFVHVAPSSMT